MPTVPKAPMPVIRPCPAPGRVRDALSQAAAR